MSDGAGSEARVVRHGRTLLSLRRIYSRGFQGSMDTQVARDMGIKK